MLNSTGMATSALHPSWFIMVHLDRGCISTRPFPCQFVTVRRQWESESPTLLNLFLPDFGFKMPATHCFGAILACVLYRRHWCCSYCQRHRSSHHFYQAISSEQTQNFWVDLQQGTNLHTESRSRPCKTNSSCFFTGELRGTILVVSASLKSRLSFRQAVGLWMLGAQSVLLWFPPAALLELLGALTSHVEEGSSQLKPVCRVLPQHISQLVTAKLFVTSSLTAALFLFLLYGGYSFVFL